MNNLARSKNLVSKYIGKKVTAALDGDLFDHEPTTFSFRFLDPEELRDSLAEEYSDYLVDSLPCLGEEGEWTNEDLVPVAAVSANSGEDDDEPPDEFAWLFLDWRAGETPRVLVTTSDDWSEDRMVGSLDELNLRVSG